MSGDEKKPEETPAKPADADRPAPPSIDEGDPRSTDDGSGTSATD